MREAAEEGARGTRGLKGEPAQRPHLCQRRKGDYASCQRRSQIPFGGRRVLRGGASIKLGRGVRDGGDPSSSGPPASGEIDTGARSSVLYSAEASERHQ
jgi:hypothetical protein